MKERLLLGIIFLITSAVYSQNSDSVLSQGNWYKFSVDTTGVFRIDRNLLAQIGVSLNNLDPRKIHIYGNGGNLLPERNSDFRYDSLQENAIYVAGEADGVFDNTDYILFYAKGPHDWVVNPASNSAAHRQNIYSDKAYYFIKVDDTDGKRITTATPVTEPTTLQVTTFDDYIFYEKENVNLFAIGRQWFGEDFNVEHERTFVIPFPNVVQNESITVKVRGVAASALASSMDVSVNGQNVYSLNYAPVSGLTLARAGDRTTTIANTNENISVTITYNNNGNPSARAYLDYIEIKGKKNLIANQQQFAFRSFDAANAGGNVVEYQINNAANIFQIWDVSDHINPRMIENQSAATNFTFKENGGLLKEYILLNQSDFYTPEAVTNGNIANQNLHALQDINYLIITNSELSSEAQRLASYHETNSNYTTKVVLLDEIYNEFSSGSKDITGIRDFIKRLYDTNTAADKKLKYVCFFGDSSYDYKDRIVNNNNIVPVYEAIESFNLATSYVSDDFFAMLDPNEGTMVSAHTVDIATGRIPVTTIQEAREAVNKIISYYGQQSLGDWRNVITLLSDDIDANSDIAIQSGVEKIADSIKRYKPVFNVNKIYADAFTQQTSSGGERYPDVNLAITNSFEKGTLLLDYFGHGGEDGFASERILDRPQIQSFLNENTLPLLITITCEFTRFDNPNRETAGELTFKNSQGGAVSMITTTREVFITVGQNFNEDLIRILLEFEGEDLTIAEALAKTKNEFTSSEQKFFIYYLGDPAMKLAIPSSNILITKMNGIDVSQSLDTLKALSRVRFEGIVTDNTNTVLPNFNGTLSTTVYDKPVDKRTLDNDGFGISVTFDSQESKLFTGKASVENGVFNFDFIVPKDIRIAYGKGKLSFYATDQQIDKAGYNLDVVVGGINENAPADNTGPEIQLFMNDESFIDGGNTNTSPNLIALLSDESGINTSITSVDHDIVAILDGDESNPIILNDFYETELNDFTKGRVTHRLRNLTVGPHTLKLKAWDTYNNSSEATLNFVVVSDAILNLENVLNYPNPFVNYTEFWFNHNKPNEPLEVQVQVFTVSGKLVKTINQSVQTTGHLSRNITWNGLDDFGNKIGKGVYIYKLMVRSTISNLVSQKYEKLVILQ
ncbi:MAG: type IX secretion system sortase PorU [Flavobacteriaceae bacterium]|nr:MAG: type IX secretion system sortase PorU [Flavobacteriaceae bacterium]